MASTVQTERVGIAAVDKIITSAGWFFREQPQPDEGVDAQVESATDDGRPSGKLLGFQIKSGASWFSRPSEGGWHYSIRANNLAYWRRYSLPVVIVLYHPEQDEAYWQVVSEDLLIDTGRGRQMILVPSNHPLGSEALQHLQALADRDLPAPGAGLDTAIRERRAVLDIGWIEMLASGKKLFVEAQEWVNKTSGRGSLKLLVEEANGVVRSEHEWPWLLLPGGSYGTELPRIFPWADLRIDEEFYRDEVLPAFYAEQPWDHEDQRYVLVDDFDEWFDREYGNALKPYAEAAGGEVALWRLELRLNDLGRATLRRAHDEDEEDAMRTYDIVRQQAFERQGGHYRAALGDFPGGQRLEMVIFESERVDETVVAADRLLGDHSLVAEQVLQHVLDREPTAALVQAFCGRFATALSGDEWELAYDDVIAWLRDLRVSL
ncbi:MAG TPA: DUF4365 domain-containing protein [Acidimicrobiales bacterium]|nr:DUF4365 domain-containing protein [Acidimicrobiales bacterium]